MIELLTVMLLLSIMSALALPNFLDFRRDAKVAKLRQNLSAIRVGIRNQLQQSMLKCGVTVTRTGTLNRGGFPVHGLFFLSYLQRMM